MKQVLFLTAMLFTLLVAAPAFANSLPPHFAGLGVFTFKGTVSPAENLKAAKAYAKEMRERNINFVIVKSHDGDSWGTLVNGKWQPAISKDLVEAFHAEDIRVYSYFTARFKHANSVSGSIRLAVRTLDMGADGVVVDDLGWLGGTTEQWTTLFADLRKEIDKRQGTVLAFSSFPHFVQWEKSPWHVALKYSHYFLPQEYWSLFKAGKGKMEPQNALAYGQSQFDILKSRYPEYAHCQLVPVGMTYGKHVDAKQIRKFLEAALPYFHITLFTFEETSKSEWKIVSDIAKKFDPRRKLIKISTFDRINNPPKADQRLAEASKPPETDRKQVGATESPPTKPTVGKKPPQKKTEQAPYRANPVSRCGACP